MEDQNKIQNQEEEIFEFGGIFDMKAEDFEEKNEGNQFNQDFYSPRLDLDTVKNKTYSSRIRFVPNVYSGKERKDRIRKYTYYLPDPDNVGKKYYIDAPCNDPKAKDIATNAYMMFVFEKSKIYDQSVPIQIAKNCKELKRNTYNYSLVQVMLDAQQPEMQGHVKIFRYGKAVNDKCDLLIKGDPAVGRASVIPFDPFKGKDFLLTIVEGVNSNGNSTYDYDKSSFDDGIIAMSLDGGKTRVQPTTEGKKAIYEYLKNESPKLDQVEFKPLTPQEEDKLIRTVRMLINDDYWFNKVYKYTYGKDYVPVVTTESITGAQQYAPSPAPQVAQPTVVTSAQVETPVVTPSQPETPASTTANKFRSLKAEAQAGSQPAVTPAQSETPVVTPAQPETPAQQAAPAPQPSLADMGGGDIEALMGGDISEIEDIR